MREELGVGHLTLQVELGERTHPLDGSVFSDSRGDEGARRDAGIEALGAARGIEGEPVEVEGARDRDIVLAVEVLRGELVGEGADETLETLLCIPAPLLVTRGLEHLCAAISGNAREVRLRSARGKDEESG